MRKAKPVDLPNDLPERIVALETKHDDIDSRLEGLEGQIGELRMTVNSGFDNLKKSLMDSRRVNMGTIAQYVALGITIVLAGSTLYNRDYGRHEASIDRLLTHDDQNRERWHLNDKRLELAIERAKGVEERMDKEDAYLRAQVTDLQRTMQAFAKAQDDKWTAMKSHP